MIFSKVKNIYCLYDFVTQRTERGDSSYYQIKKLFSEDGDMMFSVNVNQMFFDLKNQLPFLFFHDLDQLLAFNCTLTEKSHYQFAFCLSLADYNLSLPSVTNSTQWIQVFEEYGQKIRYQPQATENTSIWKKIWGGEVKD